MKKSKKIFISVLVGIGIFVLAFAGLIALRYSGYMLEAQEAEAKSNLSTIFTAEEAFHKETGEYTSQFGAMGFAPEGNLRYQIYLTDESMPQELRAKLKPQDLPIVGKNQYQVIAIREEKDGKVSGFKMDQNKKLSPLLF